MQRQIESTTPKTPRINLGKHMLPPDHTKIDSFRKWLTLFFIERGHYKITSKAIEELGPKLLRKTTEYGEPVSDRKKEPVIEIVHELPKEDTRAIVRREIEMIGKEKGFGKLLDMEYVKLTKISWQDLRVRKEVIRKFVEMAGKPEEISYHDFNKWGLGGLLVSHYENSPYNAWVEAGYAYSIEETLEHAKTQQFKDDKLYPWHMKRAPSGFYENIEGRVAAVKWLVWKTKQEQPERQIKDITQDDFRKNYLGGMTDYYYQGSPYLALTEAGYCYSLVEIKQHAEKMQFGTEKVYPWEMERAPYIYDEKENRIAAVRWLVWKLKKEPREITFDDFNNNGLGGLLGEHYKGSPYLALVEADYAYSLDEIKEHARTGFKTDKIYPWEMTRVSFDLWPNKEFRIAATKWLVWKLKKEASLIGPLAKSLEVYKTSREITKDDFHNNGLGGLLVRPEYRGAPTYLALLEAGLVTKADKDHMRNSNKTNVSR
ncbi:hypothetical protein J4450_06610 [Candidatus Micrarchaeota archaeon]|nr:hypothetical protein [Candidatus Micrarchaeota archaeon]